MVSLFFMAGCGDDGNGSPTGGSGGSGDFDPFNSAIVYGTLEDTRDGNIYRTVVMPDGKEWMAENLKYVVANGTGSWCHTNCDKYGRLYDWSTAMAIDASYRYMSWGGGGTDVQGVCPAGWRLPSDADWMELVELMDTIPGDSSTVGTMLKSEDGWYDGDSSYIPGTNDYGFSALPGGRYLSGSFYDVGYYGRWWTTTETSDASSARLWRMDYSSEHVYSRWGLKDNGYSVRCVARGD